MIGAVEVDMSGGRRSSSLPTRPVEDDGARPGLSARSLQVSPRRVARAVWALVVLAVCLGLAREVVVAAVGTDSPLGQLRPLSVDDEASIPTWAAIVLLLVGGALWGLAAAARRGERDAGVAGAVAAVLVLASVDEGASLHETLIEPLRDGLGLSGVLRFGWVLVGAPVLAGLVVALVAVRDRLPPVVARRLLLAAACLGLGAVGMELVGGVVSETYGTDSVQWGLSTLVEESLELVGAAFALLAGLELLRRRAPRLHVGLVDDAPP